MLVFNIAGKYGAYKEQGCVAKQCGEDKTIQNGILNRLLLHQHVADFHIKLFC